MYAVSTYRLPNLMPSLRGRERWVAYLMLAVMIAQTILPALPAPTYSSPTLPVTAKRSGSVTTGPIEPLPPAPTYALPDALEGKAELSALRTAHTATYDLGNGDYAMIMDSTALHYQDSNGSWLPVNPYFRRIDNGWINNSNTVQLEVDEHSTRARVVANQTGIRWQPLALEFAEGNGETGEFAHPLSLNQSQRATRSTDGKTLRFLESWSEGLQDQWQSAPGRVEYSMRLDSLPARHFWQNVWHGQPDALDLRVRLTLAPGTQLLSNGEPATLPLETDQALSFIGTDGTEMVMLPPRAYEQGAPEQAVAGHYLVAATAEANVVELRVRTPWQWLAAPERAYPIIIDPVFQVRAPTSAWQVAIDPEKPNDAPLIVQSSAEQPLSVGRLTARIFRALIRYQLPRMPVGTQIDRAYLYALPTDHRMAANIQQSAFALPLKLHEVQNSNWQGGQPLAFDSAAIGGNFLWGVHTNSTEPRTGIKWDITPQAQKWLVTAPNAPDVNNHGLLMTTSSAVESCNGYLLPGNTNFQNPFCGILFFDTAASGWDEIDLNNTQDSESADNPSFIPTQRGGLRLVIFYRNDNTLQENVPNGVDLPGGGGTPPGETPYFAADHLYRLPALSDSYWQALVLRGLGPRQGPNPPQGSGQLYQRFVQGTLNLSLKSANDKLELAAVTPAPNTVGYVLFNGAGSPFQTFDQNTLVRVGGIQGVEPSAYDIRLLSQVGSISTIQAGNTPKPGVQSQTYLFDSADPLSLWNIAMPNGSNSRVTITIDSDGTEAHDFLKQYAKEFQIKLVRADSQVDLPLSIPNAKQPHFGDGADTSFGPLKIVQDPGDGVATFQSEIFKVQSGQWGLAIAYNGPQLTSWSVPECDDEFCNDPAQVVPIKYRVKVAVHSCAEGQFPTSNGQCQVVECPTAAAFPAVTTQYVEAGGFGLWSSGDWQAAGGSAMQSPGIAAPAPLIGPPASNGTRQAPTVAIIGGRITYNTAPNPDTVTFDHADVLLVKCQPPSANVKSFEYFQVYQGAMGLFGTSFVPTTGQRINFVDPWNNGDRNANDILNESMSLRPLGGTFNGGATLRRQTGFDATVQAHFNVQWSVTVNGWPDLQSTIAKNSSDPMERIGSLTLDLGNNFSLDTPNAVDKYTARRYAGVRANSATVTQDARLGGASKSLKAVILPRGVPIPSEPAQTICPRSCIDLRSPAELFGQPLNRQWDMPDVHTDVQPGTVAFGTPGSMIVNSVDHPTLLNHPAAQNSFAQSFSFDAYQAKVSVGNEPCEPGQAPVLVIRGETRIAMPNLGSSADPNVGITAGFKLCETPPDGVGLRTVLLQFESPVGIPIGTSGLFLTALGGSVRIRPEGTRIDINVAFQTEPAGPGKILRATGTVTIDTRGLFAFKGQARLLGVFDAEGTLWVAWNPLDIGFDISGGYEEWLRGRVTAHMWRGRGWNNYTWLPNNNDMHFTASIEATLKIPQGAVVDWGPIIIPPGDISLSVALEFGEFCTNNSCTSYEWGIKGSFTIIGEEVGLYYGFDEGLDFILGNDDHILIDQHGGAQAAPVMASGVDMSDRVTVLPGPAATNGIALVPLPVSSQAESFMVVVGWQAGAPLFSLLNPDGVEITLENAAQHQVQTHSTGESIFMTVTAPKAGIWQAKISNLSEAGIEHYKLIYLANKGQPGEPGNRGSILLPAVQNEAVSNGQYNVTWQVPNDISDQATIALYYRRTEVITGNLQIDVPIVRNLPAKTGNYLWDTSRMLAGTYQVKAVIDDGINELPTGKVSIPQDTCMEVDSGLPRQRAFDPLRFPGTIQWLSTGTVQVVDTSAPSAPAALQLNPANEAIFARWEASSAVDVAAYQIVWGPKNGGEPSGFTPVNQALVTVGGALIYRIGAVSPGIEYGVHVIAIDVNGNSSTPTATQFAQPGAGGNPIPATPTNLTRVERTSTSAGFTWSPGAGAVPAGYRVTYTLLGIAPETMHVDVTTPNVTLTGLQTGGYYAVQVAAFNSDGWFSAATEAAYVSITNGVDGNGDGLPDDWAAAFGISGGDVDSDGDGLTNAVEQESGSYPNLQDSDGDGLSDGEEQLAGTAWYDSLSYDTYLHPRLALTENKLRFRAKLQAGGEAAPQSVSWINAGGGSLNLTSSSASSWILHSVNGSNIQISIKTDGLTPGFYSGVVKLGAAPGSGPLVGDPACIRVNAWILPADNDVPAKLNQVINFAPLPNKRLGDAPFAVTAASSSGLPVTFGSNTPSVCSLAGNMVTLTAIGTCTITAMQLGDTTYRPASSVNQSFQVLAQGQTMTFFTHLPVLGR